MDRTLSIADLRELLEYVPETGALLWKVRDPRWFAGTGRGGSSGACARWNARFAGMPALNIPAKTGHLAGQIFRKAYRAPRVIWAIVYGRWPSEYIDHINGNPRDNRIDNLRDVPSQTNMMNQKRYASNTSGVTGVCAVRSRWWAYISHKGRDYHLGYFDNLEDAKAARKKAEKTMGFSPRHGS